MKIDVSFFLSYIYLNLLFIMKTFLTRVHDKWETNILIPSNYDMVLTT